MIPLDFSDQATAETNPPATFLYTPLENLALLSAPAATLAGEQGKEVASSEWQNEIFPFLSGRRGRRGDKFPIYWTQM